MNPVDIVQPLLAWYGINARDLPWRREVSPYRVWISEIMLQQTRVESVKNYFTRFTAALPNPAALATVDEKSLLKLWEGLGYYSRARNLQKTAGILLEQYGGELPADYEKLLTLPGIGTYTAGAIASIAYGIAVPAVDGNVLRVVSRLTANDADVADPAVKRSTAKNLSAIIPTGHAGEFNQAVMELGALICVPNGVPNCLACPLAGVCEAHRRGIERDLPVKSPKKPRRIEPRTVFLLMRDQRLAVRQRPAKGLLAGLWELPSVSGILDTAGAVEQTRAWGFAPLRIEPIGKANHIFTHIEWQMTGYRVTVEEMCVGSGLEWIDPRALQEEFPLPSAFAYFLKDWKERMEIDRK